ncbi:SAV_915 family protein [Rhodococcus sp. 1168]|uniref:SAV_915 family protein n=1 Tax=Rhodococcus sp. 1168 TaxID=2018041 RepID=UPI0020CAA2E2|nr:SAV_915 family protein [Rhodococcus sp. 1168]
MNIPADFPPVLYVPCVQQTHDATEASVRMRTTRDGRSAVLVYSALDRLHTCVGTDVPWMVLPTERLAEVRDAAPFDLVLLDVVVPEHERAVGR